jgi:AraC family transcriptional regulator of adaptative response / DNA-3-methyladenine glycosylase II
MDLTDKHLLYKIVRARDKRYDGRFYCGVLTTGIYCRPICPARPKIENIAFYRSPAEAENAGLRACLRCRPAFAPTSVQWNGTAAIVGRALTMISRGEADDISFDRFAGKLGVSDRHLRRLFEEHVGASPIEVAASKRLHLAKQLLTNSTLPMTEVAFASGYRSIRRFNEAFKEKFQTAPFSVRRSLGQAPDVNSGFIRIEIPIIAPFDWDHILGFLGNHGIQSVESFVNGRYRRSFAIGDAIGAVEVGYEPKKGHLSAAVSVSDSAYLRATIERVRDLFDTRSNPHAQIHGLTAKDSVAACYRSELGIRVPGAWDPFEAAVCIILGQLVSVEQAGLKVAKLVERFGTKISAPVFSDCTHLFPSARVLSRVELKDLGITRIREQALRELSIQVMEKKIDLSRSADIAGTKAQLGAIPGIGPWTVEMIAMRCLGDPNAFPRTDLIVKRALEHHQNEKGDWSPWNAYIALALWKKYAVTLSRKGKKRVSTKRSIRLSASSR